MMIQDMDICLNVTWEPVVAAKKRKVKYLKTSVKRLKKPLRENIVESNKETKDVSTQEAEGKKRIKQKSLAAIFAKKLEELEETNTITSNISSKIPDKNSKAKITKLKKITQSDERNKNLESDKNTSAVSSDITGGTSIRFAKTTQQHIGKTLLAKKRNILEDKQKKSLSDIFSSQLKSQNKSDHLVKKDDIDEKKKPNNESKIIANQPSASRDIKRIDLNKRKKKKYEERIANNDVKSNKIQNLTNKPSGKIASLFSHNPDIPIIGQRLVKPVNEPIFTEITFADLNIHPFMISNLEQNMCITKMTTVQQKAIPQILSSKDILIRSQTGSGKTLAYALPIVELLHKIRPKLSRNSGLLALVIVPTRELALQTYECFIKLVKPFTWIVAGYLIGGEKRKAEKARLRKGCNILIATPGRLLDHIKHTEALRLNEVKYFVLDEADRMLDMGYEKDISEIVSVLKMTGSSEGSGYDAMKMLKQNIKKSEFTDKEIEVSGKGISKEVDTISDNKVGEYNIDDDQEKSAYHSSDDDDQIVQPVVPLRKKNRNTKDRLGMNKEFDSELKDVKSTEQDSKSANQSGRQTILLSATLTQAVEKLAGLAMQNPFFVDAARENLQACGGDVNEINEDLVVPESVMQSYIVTPPKLRIVTLSAYIIDRCQAAGQHKILIFMATQDMVDYHTEILSAVLTKPIDDDDDDSDSLVNVEFFKLYGNMTQKERTEVFKTFRQAKSGVLLCTDVAARGLDMPKVDCVIQYTGPISARDYVHRIGRTARAGSSGTATIFLTPPEIEFVRMLESRRIRIKQENMDDVLGKLSRFISKRVDSVKTAAVVLQDAFENLVLDDPQLNAKACKAYVSWVRFYSTYPRDMREIFNRKELHLGHYAKSFALRDPPQRIGEIGKKLRKEEDSKPKHNNRLSIKPSVEMTQKEQRSRDGQSDQRTGLLKRVRMLNTSEYDSGLEPLKKTKK